MQRAGRSGVAQTGDCARVGGRAICARYSSAPVGYISTWNTMTDSLTRLPFSERYREGSRIRRQKDSTRVAS